MSWWCAASTEPWSWAPRAYVGIWLFMGALLFGYLWVCRDHRTAGDRRQRWFFFAGWLLLWASSDWPLGTLGAGYLASAHMTQYLLYTMAAAPLLVLGLPEAVMRRGLSRLRAYRFVTLLARPLVAGIVFNVVLLATHAPVTVDALRTSQLGSFALDLAWLLSGLILWLPVCGPLDELKPSYPARCVYLFLAAGLVPMVPGGFLTFAGTPLYAIYELAPRVGGIDALEDQQAAGVIMKVGNLPLLWPVLAGLFLRWANQERASSLPAPAGVESARK